MIITMKKRNIAKSMSKEQKYELIINNQRQNNLK